ncbi:MAG: ABC transporter permease [Actinobacteria bacterium]|nr:ABC transporter permease [Actinomycetota bacterium]
MRTIALLLQKDLRLLRRSPVLLGILVAYPIAIALLVGLVAGYASAKPRVALVDEEGLPSVVVVGGERFDVAATIDRVSEDVTLVRLPRAEAERQLRTGKIVASLTVPVGFMSDLRRMARSPRLELRTTRGGLSTRVTQQVQALVYSLNRQLQSAYIDANLDYVRLIRKGGDGSFLGRRFEVLGLDGTERLLAGLPPDERVDRVRRFIRIAGLALDQTDDALRATANPIELVTVSEGGRTWVLSAQIQAYALALTISLLALLLAAGAIAAERDENVIGRLTRGLATLGQIVLAKIALAATVATALGLAIAVAFGAIIELGEVEGGEPWGRLPVLAAGIVLAGASLGAVGALLGVAAREARTASLVALLVALPVVFLGLVPREVVPEAGLASDAFPFAHAVRYFGSALYDSSPWAALLREAAWLLGIGTVFAVAARFGARRLSA